MSYLPKSTPPNIARRYRKLMGEGFQERFFNCVQWYKKNGFDIKSKIYKEVKHNQFGKNKKVGSRLISDCMAFYNSGEGFQNDELSVGTLQSSIDDKEK